MPVARILPCSDSWGPPHRFFNRNWARTAGWTDARSSRVFTVPARHDACIGWKSAFRKDLYETDVGNWQELFARGFHNSSLVLLSCAA